MRFNLNIVGASTKIITVITMATLFVACGSLQISSRVESEVMNKLNAPGNSQAQQDLRSVLDHVKSVVGKSGNFSVLTLPDLQSATPKIPIINSDPMDSVGSVSIKVGGRNPDYWIGMVSFYSGTCWMIFQPWNGPAYFGVTEAYEQGCTIPTNSIGMKLRGFPAALNENYLSKMNGQGQQLVQDAVSQVGKLASRNHDFTSITIWKLEAEYPSIKFTSTNPVEKIGQVAFATGHSGLNSWIGFATLARSGLCWTTFKYSNEPSYYGAPMQVQYLRGCRVPTNSTGMQHIGFP